jgi:hypothetical protein
MANLLNTNADFQSSGPEFLQAGPAEKFTHNKANAFLKILSFNFDLQTAALAGNRFVGYEINVGGTQVEVLSPPLPEKAPDGTNLYGICGFIGAPHDTVVASRTITMPLPNLLIPFGGIWSAIAPSKQVGDTFPLFRLQFEWLYP